MSIRSMRAVVKTRFGYLVPDLMQVPVLLSGVQWKRFVSSRVTG
jgi:hypothetical protein